MLFRNSYNHRIKNQELTNGDLTMFAGMFGLPAESLQIDGANSLKEITFYTCVKILSETIGKLPLKIYQDSGGIRKATDHYLYQLLKLRPNPYMSAFDFWKSLETQLDIHGNSYAYIDIASGSWRVQGLYPLDSTQMRIFVDDIGLLTSKNKVWYQYSDDAGNQHLYNSDSIMHFKGVTLDGIVGLSVVEALRYSIENAKSASTFLNNSYKKGMQSAGILQYIGDLDTTKQDILRANFERMTSGLVNANRIPVMPLGTQYQPLQLKLTDAQFLENTRLTIQQLTAAFGIKPHQVNDQTKTSYASTSEANREFYTDTLLAKLTMYEQEMSYKLFIAQEIAAGFYAKFNADVILRGDTKTRYETYSQAIQNGIKTPNECRALEEDPPMEGGDQLIVNGNYIPLTMVGKQYVKGGEK